jgi:hypothetical protein
VPDKKINYDKTLGHLQEVVSSSALGRTTELEILATPITNILRVAFNPHGLDSPLHPHETVTAEHRGQGRWVVLDASGRTLGRSGEWEDTPASDPGDAFLTNHLFLRGEASAIARERAVCFAAAE